MAYKPQLIRTLDYGENAAIYKIGVLSQLLARLDTELVDFVGIGDSNQLQGGYGWDHGLAYALTQYYSMYATGLVSANENSGSGSGQGYKWSYSSGADVGASTGAPADLAQYLPAASIQAYAYFDDAGSVSATFTGLKLDADCPVSVNDNLSFRFHYGTFPTGTSSITLQVRRADSPYTTLGTQAIDPVTGSYGMTSQDVDITAATRDYPIAAYWMQSGSTLEGPSFFTYQHAISDDTTAGFALGTLIGTGGNSAYDAATTLETLGVVGIGHYFGILRARQGTNKHICIVINSGLNDRGETSTSAGQIASTDGDSSIAFLDNIERIMQLISNAWGANGWSRDELTFMIMVSHPIDDPDDAELTSYRRAVLALCDAYPNVCAVNLANLTDNAEMLSEGWYASSGADTSHLTQTGYEQLALRVIDTARA